MSRDPVIRLRQKEEITYVILNRPHVYNALSKTLLQEPGDLFDRLRRGENNPLWMPVIIRDRDGIFYCYG